MTSRTACCRFIESTHFNFRGQRRVFGRLPRGMGDTLKTIDCIVLARRRSLEAVQLLSDRGGEGLWPQPGLTDLANRLWPGIGKMPTYAALAFDTKSWSAIGTTAPRSVTLDGPKQPPRNCLESTRWSVRSPTSRGLISHRGAG